MRDKQSRFLPLVLHTPGFTNVKCRSLLHEDNLKYQSLEGRNITELYNNQHIKDNIIPSVPISKKNSPLGAAKLTFYDSFRNN